MATTSTSTTQKFVVSKNIGLTLNEYNKGYVDMAKKYGKNKFSNIVDLISKQYEDETIVASDRLLSSSYCSPRDMIELKKVLGNVKYNELQKSLRNTFYDPSILKLMGCLTDSLAIPSTSKITVNERLRHWIINLKKISVLSVSGDVAMADLSDAKNVYVIKTLQEPADEFQLQYLFHEYFIGIIATNKLREITPNFAYIYSFFSCSPSFASSKNITAWCQTDKPSTNYIAYENIYPSMSYTDYTVRSTSFTEWFSYYLQILFALKIAHEKYDFTHYDLHGQNVLLRDVTDVNNENWGGQSPDVTSFPALNATTLVKDFYLPYKYNNKIYYIKTNRVATIIDYGQSHIKFNGKNYGLLGIKKRGVFSDKSFILTDAYKLLTNLTMNYIETRTAPDDIDQMEEEEFFITNLLNLFNFFFSDLEDSLDVLTASRENYYHLPETPKILKYTLDDFINYIFNDPSLGEIANKIVLIKSQPDKNMLNVLGCNNTGKLGICKSIDEHKQKLGISEGHLKPETKLHRSIAQRSKEYIAKDVIGFVDLYSTNEDLRPKIRKSFDVSKRMKEAELSINKRFAESKKKYKTSFLKSEIVDLTPFPISEIINLKWDQKKQILDTLSELLEFMSDYQKIKLLVKSMIYVNKIYKKFNVEMRRIRKTNQQIDFFYKKIFSESFETIEENIFYLAGFKDLPRKFDRWLELYGIRFTTLSSLYDEVLSNN